MADSTIIVPANYGMWAGPSYAGGKIYTTNDDPNGEIFRQRYAAVNPIGYLDAAARKHDAAYELADRLYGKTGKVPNKGNLELAQFRADLDLLRNALAYPVNTDYIGNGADDFIGRYYRDMLVKAESPRLQ